jgi:GR25 family glycosyltransferase involved in LPS biosynthesis
MNVTTSSRTSDNLDKVANGTLGFGAIFVLGLPDRSDKRDALELAAALTGLQIIWVDGVPGDKMHPKATPPIHFDPDFQDTYGFGMPNDGQIGCWRGHMNIWREMIRAGISSALILEDDVDWDVRIVDQMKKFAIATKELGSKRGLQIPKNAATQAMTDSPYGEDWELLYPGHCNGFPHPDKKLRNFHSIIRNDTTVAPIWDMYDLTYGLAEDYYKDGPCATHAGRDPPGRTCDSPRLGSDERIVQLGSPMCTMAYAISQRGARHFLAHLGGVSLLDATGPIDRLMMEVCRGHKDRDGEMTKCMVVSPPYFQSHRPRGVKSGESDIMPFGGEVRESVESHVIVLSTKINLKNLVAGRAPESQYIEDNGVWRFKNIDEYTDQ